MFGRIPFRVVLASVATVASLSGLLTLTASASASNIQWVDGTIVTSSVNNCGGNGSGSIQSWVSYAADVDSNGHPTGSYPKTGDVFYVRLLVADLTQCSSYSATEEIQAPSGTVPAVSSSNPIRCIDQNFNTNTSTQVTAGCPTSVQTGTGQHLSIALGTHPVAGFHGFEIDVPMRSKTALDGTSSASDFRGYASGTGWGPQFTSVRMRVPQSTLTVTYPSPSATSITQTSAHLRANIATHSTGGTAYFDFGKTTSYGTTKSLAVPANLDTFAVAENISGLSPGTTYHWRVRYVTGSQTVTGADQSFKTVPANPVLSSYTLSPTSFKAATSGPSIAPSGGTTVSFVLSEAATVLFKVQKLSSSGTWVAVPGSFSFSGRKGSNQFHFSGRVGGVKLKPATYRLRATATDSGGRTSNTVSARFVITG